MIVFSDYVIGYDKVQGVVRPSLVLETACLFARDSFVTEGGTNQFWRRSFSRDVPGGIDDLHHEVIREELLSATWANYGDGDDFLTFRGTDNNDDEMRSRADMYLDGEILKLVPDEAETRVYAGLQAIYPDGAICCVSWALGGGGTRTPSTTASRNTEHSIFMPTYGGRRQREEVDLAASARRNEEAAQRKRMAGFLFRGLG
jgi:hypothetical protein